MPQIILADNQEIFRTGMTRILAWEDDLQIVAQCPNCARLHHAMTIFRGAVVIAALSLRADLDRLIAETKSAANRLILVAEYREAIPAVMLAESYGLIYRNISKAALLKTVRQVIRGEASFQPVQSNKEEEPEDLVGLGR